MFELQYLHQPHHGEIHRFHLARNMHIHVAYLCHPATKILLVDFVIACIYGGTHIRQSRFRAHQPEYLPIVFYDNLRLYR